jgi:hypothetical protein
MEDCLPCPIDEPDICRLREVTPTHASQHHHRPQAKSAQAAHSAHAVQRFSRTEERSRKSTSSFDLLRIVGTLSLVLAVLVNIGSVEASSVLPAVKEVEHVHTSSAVSLPIHYGKQPYHGDDGKFDEIAIIFPVESISSDSFDSSTIDPTLLPSPHHAPTSHYIFHPMSLPQTLISLLSTIKERWLAARRTSIYLHHYRPLDVVIQEQQTGLKKRLTQTEKIEAGFIPILVILSGIFAGCTLG